MIEKLRTSAHIPEWRQARPTEIIIIHTCHGRGGRHRLGFYRLYSYICNNATHHRRIISPRVVVVCLLLRFVAEDVSRAERKGEGGRSEYFEDENKSDTMWKTNIPDIKLNSQQPRLPHVIHPWIIISDAIAHTLGPPAEVIVSSVKHRNLGVAKLLLVLE